MSLLGDGLLSRVWAGHVLAFFRTYTPFAARLGITLEYHNDLIGALESRQSFKFVELGV